MSTFGGLMVEYPQIAIDCFQGDGVLRARGYFLSHCHADHMSGLGSRKFADRLTCCPHIKLYSSEVTQKFLLSDPRFAHLGASLSSLPVEQATMVILVDELTGKEEKVLVTLLPAGHCPGSVMFLFEGDQGTVLYTGDFRLAKGEAARMQPLHSGSRVKDISSVYLDTTFCVPEAMYIPSREESKDALIELVGRQIQQSKGHMVRLNCKAKYGYEFLFVEMSKMFNQPVHVSENVMSQYKHVPDLAMHLTTEGSITQIHACKCTTANCSLRSATNVITIQPSTMWFTCNARPDDVMRKIGTKYRLCFSFHSSYSEIRDFVGYIKPRNISPNVIPHGSSEREIINRLSDLLRGASNTKKSDAACRDTSFKPLGPLKNIRRINRKRHHEDGDRSCGLFETSPDFKKREIWTGDDGTLSEEKEERLEEGECTHNFNGNGLNSYNCTFADSDGALSDSDSYDGDGYSIEQEEDPGIFRLGGTSLTHPGISDRTTVCYKEGLMDGDKSDEADELTTGPGVLTSELVLGSVGVANELAIGSVGVSNELAVGSGGVATGLTCMPLGVANELSDSPDAHGYNASRKQIVANELTERQGVVANEGGMADGLTTRKGGVANELILTQESMANELTERQQVVAKESTEKPRGVANESTVKPGGVTNESTVVPGGVANESTVVPGGVANESTVMPGGVANESTVVPGGVANESTVVPGGVANESTVMPGDVVNDFTIRHGCLGNEWTTSPGAVAHDLIARALGMANELNLREGGVVNARSGGVANDLTLTKLVANEWTTRPGYEVSKLNVRQGAANDLIERQGGLSNTFTTRLGGVANELTVRQEGVAKDMSNGECKADEDSSDGDEDGELGNLSQCSFNEGSIKLFSDDSQGDSQRSEGSCDNWLQYLPPKHTTTLINGYVAREISAEQEMGGHQDNPSSPLLISDDSDSDVTFIQSQHSIGSQGSKVSDVAQQEGSQERYLAPRAMTRKREHQGTRNDPCNDENGLSQASLNSNDSSVIEILSTPE